MTYEGFASELAELLDEHRQAVTRVKRVVLAFEGGTLESSAATMTIPLLYAHWEAFVREGLTLYIEFVERHRVAAVDANPSIFAFSLRKQLRALVGKQRPEALRQFAEKAIEMAGGPVRFVDKTIDTKSNLNFKTLEALCFQVGLKVTTLQPFSKKIDALVNRRNEIAHGAPEQKLRMADVEENAALIMELLEGFERLLNHATCCQAFRRAREQGQVQ